MIAFPRTNVPVPDRIAVMTGDTIPDDVQEAETVATNAAYIVGLCRTPETREAREIALSDLAAANKILAAYNPGLMVIPGGGQR